MALIMWIVNGYGDTIFISSFKSNTVNNETLQILIEPRTDVNECMSANTHTFILDCNNLRYECTIALPCTDMIVCGLLSELLTFNQKTSSILHRVIEDEEHYYQWTIDMQKALVAYTSMRIL